MSGRMEAFLPENKKKEPKSKFIWEFDGMFSPGRAPSYPAWRYHKVNEPVLVKNTEEDEKYKLQGYDAPWTTMISNNQLINWYWDLEDMSAKQLSVFAMEEYGIDLPEECGQERLMKAIMELGREAPQNQGRIVLMALTIQMNYDATLAEISKISDKGMSENERSYVEI
jgi:hypothetical protein